MTVRVVNLKKESCDVYIGRGSIWGNPYSHKWKYSKYECLPASSRIDAVRKYQDYILERSDLLDRLQELRGKTLGCYCKPAICHGDVLVELIQERCGEHE